MSYSSHRGYTGPANVLPRLRCERLEDRSLLSVGGLFVLQDLPEVFVEDLPPDAGCDTGIVVEDGVAVEYPVDEEIANEEVEFTFDDSEYWDDAWSYDEDIYENWVAEDEFYDETWYEEVYFDDTWNEEVYFDDTWNEEVYFDDTWNEEVYFDDTLYEEEYYEESWEELPWVDSWVPEEDYDEELPYEEGGELVIDPVPVDELGGWQVRDLVDWAPLPDSAFEHDDELVFYTTVSAGGIPVFDLPALPEITEFAGSPLVAPIAAEVSTHGVALPPSAAANNTYRLPEISAPRGDEGLVSAPSLTQLGNETAEDSSSSRLAITWESKDHLAEPESLELSGAITMD